MRLLQETQSHAIKPHTKTSSGGTQHANPPLTDAKDVKIEAFVHFLVHQLIGKAIKSHMTAQAECPHAVPLE